MAQRNDGRSKVKLDLLVNVMHCVQKQRNLSSGVKTNCIHRDVPVSVLAVNPRNEPCPGLQPVISVTYKKHLTLQVLQMRTVKQP
jgi:hypothetical protein